LNPEKLALTLARHPNIIEVQEIWSNYESFDDEFPLFVLFFMERVDGNLEQYLCKKQNRLLGGHIDEPEMKYWFLMIVSGLEYLLSISIAHLDFNIQNIL
jgi:serine/threonine protein kinase